MSLRSFYNQWISPQLWLDRAGVRPPMQAVLGIVLLAFCVLLFATTIKLFPNMDEASLNRRSTISEMAAIQTASVSTKSDIAALHDFLETIVDRYDDMLSAGLRSPEGSIVTQTSAHEHNWLGARPNINTPTHIRVPLFKNQKPWGELELCFSPLAEPTTWRAWWFSPMVRLTVFILAALFLLSWVYMSRMLRSLDPSAAVPQRMQLLLDTMVEGVAILDAQDNIVMANQSFATTAFTTIERLIGRKLSSLPWLAQDLDEMPNDLPWKNSGQTRLQQRGVLLRLKIGTRNTRRLAVNVSSITGNDDGTRGLLVTFDDQTAIEAENVQLAQAVMKIANSGNQLPQLLNMFQNTVDREQLSKLQDVISAVQSMAQFCNSASQEAKLAAPILTEQGSPITNSTGDQLHN